MPKNPLILIGVGNMLGDIHDCAEALGRTVTTIVTNAPEAVRPRTKSLHERLVELAISPRVVPLEEFSPEPGAECFLVPTTPARATLVDRLIADHPGISFATLVHPRAIVARSARIGRGVFVGAGSVIASCAVLEPHAFVNRAASIGHDSIVRSFARIQPGAAIAGHVLVGVGATIGLGALVIEEREVGPGAVVAAGAVVIHDVSPHTLVAGVPAVCKKHVG
jgi:sugar O-acyltransferase (sialic acid O-acetyltransferase NeuD family)